MVEVCRDHSVHFMDWNEFLSSIPMLLCAWLVTNDNLISERENRTQAGRLLKAAKVMGCTKHSLWNKFK